MYIIGGPRMRQNLYIENIPAILWGEETDKIMVAVHGNMSSKDDETIALLAEAAISSGYQVLSFDLPQHGDRKEEATPCKVQNCVHDLGTIMNYVRQGTKDVSLFACSMGAYFSLLAYRDVGFRQSLFLSPVVDMGRIIENMMNWFQVSKERLQEEQEIATPAGPTLYWDYYCYVRDNPVVRWQSPTAILYGSEDNLCELEVISTFSDKFACELEIMEKGEHYFHTPEQLNIYRTWLGKHIS